MNPLRIIQKQLREQIFDPEHWKFLNEICSEDPALSKPDFVKNVKSKLQEADKVGYLCPYLIQTACTLLHGTI